MDRTKVTKLPKIRKINNRLVILYLIVIALGFQSFNNIVIIKRNILSVGTIKCVIYAYSKNGCVLDLVNKFQSTLPKGYRSIFYGYLISISSDPNTSAIAFEEEYNFWGKNNAFVSFWAGKNYFISGNPQKALYYFKQVSNINSYIRRWANEEYYNNPKNYENLLYIALSIDPYDWKARYSITKYLMEKGRIEDARKVYSDAMDLLPLHNLNDQNPLISLVFSNYGILLNRNIDDPKLALFVLEYSLSLYKKNISAILEIGHIYRKQNDLHLALQWYKKAYDLDNNNSYSAMWLGRTELLVGNMQSSIEHLESAAKLNHNNDEILYFLGRSYETAGMNKEALNAYYKALQIHPDKANYLDAIKRLETK